MSKLIESTLAYLGSQLEVPSQELNLSEAYITKVQEHPVGTTIHPYSTSSYGRASHSSPLTISRKLASKTELTRAHDGAKFHVSHATGKVTNAHSGTDSTHGHEQFHTDAEKKEVDDRKAEQHGKNAAADAIHKHLEGMKNGFGNHVGTLSDSDHSEILQHLEKLREKK